jgi:UPF0755 protein
MKKPKVRSRLYFSLGSGFLAVVLIGLTYYCYQMKNSMDLNPWETIQNITNPYSRIVKVTAGMRREEVAERFAKTLGWEETEKYRLVNMYTLIASSTDGFYFPNTYIVPLNAKATDVSRKFDDTFTEEVLSKFPQLKDKNVDRDEIMKIASIIQREASPYDMKIVSGIIWNRIKRNMPLEMDATLQYAKGTSTKWWPQVTPADKKIDSPYNTYKNKGLPPSPISNPSQAAIDAALHPIKTSALFYVHDSYGIIHTAKTYAQHKLNIQMYY